MADDSLATLVLGETEMAKRGCGLSAGIKAGRDAMRRSEEKAVKGTL
jgi:hypothetical protein